jgi:hypothetical protein
VEAVIFLRFNNALSVTKGDPMKIIHIMADGTTRDSVEGVVIKNEQFYRVLQGIVEKRKISDKKINT